MNWQQAIKLADDQQAEVATTFLKALMEPGRKVSRNNMTAMLQRMDYQGVVNEGIAAFEDITPAVQKQLETQLTSILTAYNDKAIAAQVLPRQVATSARLDLVNEEVHKWVEAQATEYLQEIHAGIEPSVTDRIKAGILANEAPAVIARNIAASIGLTEYQNQTVDSFREMLQKQRRKLYRADGSPLDFGDMSKADQRRLKLARPRKRIYGAADLTEEAIERNVALYRIRKMKETAETLSRTATIKASSEGQEMLWNRFVEKGYLDKAEWEVGWIISPDERLCPICAARKGIRREINGTYPDGSGVPPIHPRCRCGEGLYKRKAVVNRPQSKPFQP